MLFFIPPTIETVNTVTQINIEVFCTQNMTSTLLDNVYIIQPKDFESTIWRKGNLFSTDLCVENLEEQNNSTWEEDNLSNFDLVTNPKFIKTIKVKSKIKAVTRYMPNIILD